MLTELHYKSCSNNYSLISDRLVLTRHSICRAYSEAKICQSEIAASCAIPQNEDTYHFFDATEFNPYDIDAVESEFHIYIA